jgi:hypothetical protein
MDIGQLVCFLRAHESAHYALCRIPALLVILGSREL